MKNFKGLYFYRGRTITRMLGGWWFDGDIRIYKTIKDAKNAINKLIDGTHNAEPKILGEASYQENGTWKLEKL